METDRLICAAICSADGIKAKEIAKELDLERSEVNHILYSSPLLHELCWQDKEYNWHGIITQSRPHIGLQEFSGYYGLVKDFRKLSEDEWMSMMEEGCTNIGRSLNDTRGLLHSFRDCRETVLRLFSDLDDMIGNRTEQWEIAFEFRLKRARHIRIYADVLIITEQKVFSLEFKMKNVIDPDEVCQAAKYVPYLEIVFGPDYEIIPVLVLTAAHELFDFFPIDGKDMVLPVCSGDMLFNVFDEYLGFLKQ